MDKKTSSSGFLSFFSFVFLPLFAFGLGWTASESEWNQERASDPILLEENISPEKEPVKNTNVDTSLLRDAVRIVEKKFINPENIDPQKIQYGITRGFIWSLDDPYSEFMSPEESEDFDHDLDGDLEGIGAELTVRRGMIVIVSPLRGSPAEKAGLLPEDIVLKVDGEEARGEDFLNVIKRIRGEKGTEVMLSVFRPNAGEEKEIIIMRDKIRVETVELLWQDDIAVLEVSQFGTHTEREFREALALALQKDPRGIVLDLRFNSGGFLDTAVAMLSSFLEGQQKVVVQKGRPPSVENLITSGNIRTTLPLVVLQNKGSASASEIVAGALQDLDRATIIGAQSFGKGTVQELIPMKGGAHLRLTIAKWLTPNGRDIGKVGIEPDLLIERSIEDIEEDKDPQMEAALRLLNGESLEDLQSEFQESEGLQAYLEEDL